MTGYISLLKNRLFQVNFIAFFTMNANIVYRLLFSKYLHHFIRAKWIYYTPFSWTTSYAFIRNSYTFIDCIILQA